MDIGDCLVVGCMRPHVAKGLCDTHYRRVRRLGTLELSRKPMIKTSAYNSWVAMRQRCNNKNNPGYIYYGARGITVCERWDKFANFLADMGESPSGTSLDRIDNEAGYSPNNCKWSTRIEQARNRRAKFTVKGVRKWI